MVELICAVAAHFYIEQCIEMLNVFKVNHKGNIFWGLIDILLNLNMLCHMDLMWLDEERLDSLISRRRQSHLLKSYSAELKTAL